ncbi:MAG: hypothetical protein GXP49_06295 [Deltaproteobacteria bacterium]|nr:hypothetical protein [Deltaproteobacteria bacterium]
MNKKEGELLLLAVITYLGTGAGILALVIGWSLDRAGAFHSSPVTPIAIGVWSFFALLYPLVHDAKKEEETAKKAVSEEDLFAELMKRAKKYQAKAPDLEEQAVIKPLRKKPEYKRNVSGLKIGLNKSAKVTKKEIPEANNKR